MNRREGKRGNESKIVVEGKGMERGEKRKGKEEKGSEAKRLNGSW